MTYWCEDGYQFASSGQSEKHSQCRTDDGTWDPAFQICDAVSLAAAMALIQEPKEAENAPAIGSSFIILGLGIEIGVLILLDFHNIAVNLKFCRRHVRRRNKIQPGDV